MTQIAYNYAKVLYELSVSPDSIRNVIRQMEETPELGEVLQSPVVAFSQKEKVIRRVFSEETANFLCVLCQYHHVELLPEILQTYQKYVNQQNHIVDAVLSYVVPPSQEQLNGIKKFLVEKYGAADAVFEFKEDKSLMGGFVLRINDQEIDYSLKGRIHALQQKLIWR